MQYLLILASLIFLAPTSWAQIKVTDVDYASNVEYNDDGSVAKIYGGIAGPQANCNSTVENVMCNNCTQDEIACNQYRIHTNLELQVQFQVNTDISGVISVGIDGGTFGSIGLESGDYTTGTLSNGSTGFVRINWSDICNATTLGGSTCENFGNDTNYNLIIGLAANSSTEPADGSFVSIPIEVALPNADTVNAPIRGYDLLDCDDESPSTGICDFLAFPGDKKIYVDELQPVGAWPISNRVEIQFLRVYYSTTSFADANYTSTTYQDFELDDDGTPTSDVLEGLENDVPYFFRPATVDDAYNVAFLQSDDDSVNGITTGTFIGGAGCAVNDDATCTLLATPSEVLGLLTEDVNCFISTVAYGSSFSDEVKNFRKFRNKFLLPNEWGRKFVKLYYNIGPKAARFISENSYLKPVARFALWPVAFLAKQSNQYGIHIFFLGVFSLVALFGAFIIGGRQLWRKYS